jgi:hypothetical protein
MKINLEKMPEEYRSIMKEDMNTHELSQLGTVIMKNKLHEIKNKILMMIKRKKHG